jgi:ABC-type ATPase with predicted acetyltransferase domain
VNEKRTENILEVEEVIMAFGGLVALINLDFQVQHHTIKAIIGPNGAGKTTQYDGSGKRDGGLPHPHKILVYCFRSAVAAGQAQRGTNAV